MSLKGALEEFVQTEQRFIQRMKAFRVDYLAPMLASATADRAMMTEYLKNIEALEQSYEGLALNQAESDKALLELLDGPAFKVHMELMHPLALQQASMDAMQEHVKFHPTQNSSGLAFEQYTIDPIQRLMRYPMILAEASKRERKQENGGDTSKLDKIQTVMTFADDSSRRLDKKIAIKNGLGHAETDLEHRVHIKETPEKQLAQALRCILALPEAETEADKIENRTYIQTILSKTDPEQFHLENDTFYVTIAGIPEPVEYNPMGAIPDVLPLEEANKPLWQVLKSAVPLSGHAAPEEKTKKLQTLGQVLKLLEKNQLGSRSQSPVAAVLAEKATNIDPKASEQHFTPIKQDISKREQSAMGQAKEKFSSARASVARFKQSLSPKSDAMENKENKENKENSQNSANKSRPRSF